MVRAEGITMGESSGTDLDLLARLESALVDLDVFRDRWVAAVDRRRVTEVEEDAFNAARLRLAEQSGVIALEIQALTGQRYVNSGGRLLDLWDLILTPNILDSFPQAVAIRLQFVAQLENLLRRAIGLVRAGHRPESAQVAIAREVTPPPAATVITNYIAGNVGNLAQGNSGPTSQIFNSERVENLARVLNDLRDALGALEIDEDERTECMEDIRKLKEEVRSPQPRVSRVQRLLAGIAAVADIHGATEAGIRVAGLVAQLSALLAPALQGPPPS
jgi:hypothetical protein